jgi:hypothetical protein
MLSGFPKYTLGQSTLCFLVNKACDRLKIRRMLKHQVSHKVLINIYFSFIRSVLEYADIVWDNCTLHESNLLESVQVEADNYSGNPDPGDSAFSHLSLCCLDFQNIYYGNQHYFFL